MIARFTPLPLDCSAGKAGHRPLTTFYNAVQRSSSERRQQQRHSVCQHVADRMTPVSAPSALLVCLIHQGSQSFCPAVAPLQLHLGLQGTAPTVLHLLPQQLTLVLLSPQSSFSLRQLLLQAVHFHTGPRALRKALSWGAALW